MFVSRGAIRPMGATWSEELRIVAANAWWLSAFTFEDFVAFDLAYQQELDSGGGAVLGQSACVGVIDAFLFLAFILTYANDNNFVFPSINSRADRR